MKWQVHVELVKVLVLEGVVALKIESGGIILDNWFRTNGFCVCVGNFK